MEANFANVVDHRWQVHHPWRGRFLQPLQEQVGEKEVACKESQQGRLKSGVAAQAQGVGPEDRTPALAHDLLSMNKLWYNSVLMVSQCELVDSIKQGQELE